MPVLIGSFVIAALIFLILDSVWLTSMAGTYRNLIGPVLADGFRLGPAAAFYVLYVAGLVGFAILPSLEQGGWMSAAWRGAALGLVAYGTYDLTNQATLKVWPVGMTLIDMTWGTIATALTAAVTTALVAKFFGSGS